MKDVEFLGDSLDVLRSIPDGARQDSGYQLDKVQRGLEPDDWKPMKTTQKTSPKDVALAKSRYKELMREHK